MQSICNRFPSFFDIHFSIFFLYSEIRFEKRQPPSPCSPGFVRVSGKVNGTVNALKFFRNQLVAGGNFFGIGGVSMRSLAISDANENWSELGGVDGYVYSLYVFQNQLYVGGSFYQIGNITAYSIARWNGTTWHSLFSSFLGTVYAMAEFQGMLVVAGDSNSPLYRWNGTLWYFFMGDQPNNRVRTLAVVGGSLYVGGLFTAVGSKPAKYVAYWDGSDWGTLPTSNWTSGVAAIAAIGSNIFFGGSFTVPLTPNWVIGIIGWNGTNWFPIGSTSIPVSALQASGSTVFIGGLFPFGNGIAYWNGSVPTFSAVPSFNNLSKPSVQTFETNSNGDLFLAGTTGLDLSSGQGDILKYACTVQTPEPTPVPTPPTPQPTPRPTPTPLPNDSSAIGISSLLVVLVFSILFVL